jgi:hypothetical protein
LDLDLEVLCGFLPLFYLSYLSIALVALEGFEWEGFEHFVCPCHCIGCIGLSSPQRFDGEKFVELFTLWFLEP